MRSFNIVPQAHSSSSIVAISWPTHQLWKSKSEIRLPTFGCHGLDAHRHTNGTSRILPDLQTRTHTSLYAVFELLLLPWDTQTFIHYSTVHMSWLRWLRFLSSSDPVFKAVTPGFNLLNRQKGLYQHLPAKQKKKKKKGPWNCPLCLPCNSVQSLNQKKLFLHSGLSLRIIKDPKGHAGSVQTQAQAWKIKVMEMWPSSEEEP